MAWHLGETAAEATKLVSRDRNSQYGDPRDDFDKAVAIYKAITEKPVVIIETAEDHALYMVCVKLSREAHLHKWDNVVDAIGYLDIYAYLRSQKGGGNSGKDVEAI